MRYPVNELFCTVQGEANFTGRPAIFVRLQGCDVGCPWCDTKHTWVVDERAAIPIRDMAAKEKDSESWAWMDERAIIAAVSRHKPRHVVITGGEPCKYDLRPLTSALRAAGHSVQVETSGTEQILVHDETWVTVSPKFDMPGGKVVRDDALRRADEVKVPVGKQADIDRFLHRGLGAVVTPRIWLQPLSQNPTATAICIEQATARGWFVSLQTHKFAGVR